MCIQFLCKPVPNNAYLRPTPQIGDPDFAFQIEVGKIHSYLSRLYIRNIKQGKITFLCFFVHRGNGHFAILLRQKTDIRAFAMHL